MLLKVFGYITTAVTVLSLYRFVFVLIGFFSKSKIFPPANTQKKYGIIISARNESAVIATFSIQLKNKITIFHTNRFCSC